MMIPAVWLWVCVFWLVVLTTWCIRLHRERRTLNGIIRAQDAERATITAQKNDANTITLNQRKQIDKLKQTLIEMSTHKISMAIAESSPRGQDLLTVEQAALALSVSKPTIRRWLREGRLSGYRDSSPRRHWIVTGIAVGTQRYPIAPKDSMEDMQ